MISKQNNQYTMISDLIKNRIWQLKLSFFNRKCYFTGQKLQYKLCYCGRKQIKDSISYRYLNDDIWVSSKEYLKLLKSNIL
jgi:hypothetical protein